MLFTYFVLIKRIKPEKEVGNGLKTTALWQQNYSHHMVGVYLCYQERRESRELYFPQDPAETYNNTIN